MTYHYFAGGPLARAPLIEPVPMGEVVTFAGARYRRVSSWSWLGLDIRVYELA